MIGKYLDFKESLNENIQQAKVYLKNVALRKKREQSGTTSEPVGLTADEVRVAETNPKFIKIKDMCRQIPGLTFLFTKIYFEEIDINDDLSDDEKFQRLKTFFDKLMSMGNLVKELPMPLDRYASIRKTEEDQRPIMERIDDDIEKLMQEKTYNKFYQELLPWQKKMVEQANKQQKEKLKNIGIAFGQMGFDEETNKIDEKRQNSLHRVFFSKLKDFKRLDELIDFAINYIKSVNNGLFSKFIKKMDDVNNQLGNQNGAKMVFNNEGYLVIEVYTFVANRILNGHTAHCIVRHQGHWETYLEQFNKQYYVYNFNLDSTDPESVIGMTIRPDSSLRAAHDKQDKNVINTFKSLMKKWNIPFDVFKPMTEEEMDIKRRRIEATKIIRKPNLTYEEAIKALEDGADPNTQNGTPLKLAVKSNNIELVKLLLEKGALPNLSDSSDETAIDEAKNLEMLKLLVSYGATINQKIFDKVKSDLSAVTYLLDNGMNPNYFRGLPFRLASTENNIPLMEVLMKYADNIPGDNLSIGQKQLMMLTERDYLCLLVAAENCNLEATIFILDKLKDLDKGAKQFLESLPHRDYIPLDNEMLNAVIDFIDSSTSNPSKKGEMIEEVKKWFNNNINTIKESIRFKSYGEFKI